MDAFIRLNERYIDQDDILCDIGCGHSQPGGFAHDTEGRRDELIEFDETIQRL